MSPAGARATVGSRCHDLRHDACWRQPGTAAEPIIEHKRVRPSETYVAGFGGYTFGGKFSDVEGAGLLPGGNLGDRDLADAGVYGGKLGHFFGDRMDWLGVEMEAFNTTPHVEQQGLAARSPFSGYDVGLQSHRSTEIRV